MKTYPVLFLALTLTISCSGPQNKLSQKDNSENMGKYIDEKSQNDIKDRLVTRYGEENRFRIEQGVMQVARFWMEQDGSAEAFRLFCMENFLPRGEALDVLFQKLERNFEILTGNFTKMSLQLREPLDLDMGDITPIDMLMGSYDPSSHLSDDFFKNKVSFIILLNFPFYTLQDKLDKGSAWSRKEWAFARVGDAVSDRIPAAVNQNYSDIITLAGAYIDEYNIYMGNLTDSSMRSYFPAEMKLISHWGLRDEIKSNYLLAEGLLKQCMIYKVMENIITQEIPAQVINNNEYRWNPFTNELFLENEVVEARPENNVRYQHLLDLFKANTSIDSYSPFYNTAIARAFDQSMQMPLPEVEKLFTELLSSEEVRRVAQFISKRLNRPLEPFDIWYNGFKPTGNKTDEKVLDEITAKKYPSPTAFEADMPVILQKLGFSREDAQFVASRVTVDPSRGAGHAFGAEMRTEKSHLRTRIGKNGMNYKGYNIAMHEFGHNVEQTLTLYKTDYYRLKGIPNTAFTEALAFIFQKRDLELLGLGSPGEEERHLMALDIFWSCYEIMGVSLVDMAVWKWLYENPGATVKELKDAVLSISKDIWNRYYAGIFGVKDQVILAIYSHMIAYPLYLSAYPVGHLIDYQIEEYIADKDFVAEIKRIFSSGNLTPDLWMKHAVGEGISNNPLLKAVDEALLNVK
ncbi:MAG: hypothetical protein JXB00_07305 [Bacteroidales bacterium]|nr:hypothetical protein [Bacteroidales bacterium]